MRYLIACALMALVAGCSSFTEKHSRTLLLDRTTGEIKECTVDAWRSAKSYETYQDCIRSYETQGYSIWSQY